MKKQEAKEIKDYLAGLYSRINDAKSAIINLNFGEALQILSKAYPALNIKEDE